MFVVHLLITNLCPLHVCQPVGVFSCFRVAGWQQRGSVASDVLDRCDCPVGAQIHAKVGKVHFQRVQQVARI